jgi:hypothetical protein
MNKFSFFNRKRNPKPNIIFKGLGNVNLTRSQLVSDTDLKEENVKNWIENGEDLLLNINTNFNIGRGFASTLFGNIPNRILKKENLSEIIDKEGLIKTIKTYAFYQNLTITKIEAMGLERLEGGVFQGATNFVNIIAPNLINIGTAALSGFNASGIENFTLQDIGELELVDAGAFYGSKVNFIKYYFLVTNSNTDQLFRSARININPFPNLTGIGTQMFRGCSLAGEIILNEVVGSANGFLTFRGADFVTKIILPNVTEFNNCYYTFDMARLQELDLRSCKDFIFSQNNVDLALNTSPSICTLLHLHIDMKTYENGEPYSEFNRYIDSSESTVNWYNDDGTLNSTN